MDDILPEEQSNLDAFFQMFDWVDEDISELNADEENEIGAVSYTHLTLPTKA